MKLKEIKKSGPTLPEFAGSLPPGSILQGRKYKHAYLVTDQSEVVRIHDGKTVESNMKTSEYDVLPAGTTITFEA